MKVKGLLENAIIALLYEGNGSKFTSRSFYANFLLTMKREFTTKVPTAGVSVTDQINLYINPDYFESLTLQERIELLIHECEHVIRFHMERCNENNPNDQKLFNIAADATINESLTALHEKGAVTYDVLSKTLEMPNLKRGEPTEYYYQLLKEFQKNNPDKCQQVMSEYGESTDDHSHWGENEGNEELQKHTVQKKMKKAMERTSSSNIPQHVKIAMDQLNKSNVSWQQQLKRFYQKAILHDKTATRKKRNRRYGIKVSGKKKKPIAHIAVGVDESGSVYDEAFIQFMSETEKMADYVKITMIHCDAEVNNVYEYKKGMKIERSGCGGTYYSPAIEKAMELKVDGMVYFGDGDCFESEVTKPNFPMLWAMIEGCAKPVDWGALCEVKVG